ADAAENTPEATERDGRPDLEDVKRQFRAALDRKRAAHASDAAGTDGREPSRVHGTHGPASSRRSFRRKSGG
ncbi:MAG: DUF5302 domain-containing protein, partial [Streptosporangiaceae bacterium]|nr:DUF5302 domain-containing protein [Streptosporangiaceae bacterium]